MAHPFIESGSSATQDLKWWTSVTGDVTADSSQSINAPHSIKLNTGDPAASANMYKAGIMADAGRRVSFWIRFTDITPDVNSTFCSVRQSDGVQSCISIQLSTASKLRFNVFSSVANVTVVGSTTIQSGVWYRIAIAYTITDANTNEYRLYLGTATSPAALEASISNVASAHISTDRFYVSLVTTIGINHIINVGHFVVDDSTALTDPGNLFVTCKLPNANNTNNFNTAVGNNPSNRWENVDDRPLSETNGWEQLGRNHFFQAVGALGTATTNPNLVLTAPTCQADDILIAVVAGKNNVNVGTGPSGWTEKVTGVNSGTLLRASIWYKRAIGADSGANFTWTKDTDDNLLSFGVISAWRGCVTSGDPFDDTTPTSSANASSDTVTYADFNPTETSALVVAIGVYGEDATTAGSISGTNPTLTNRWDLETNQGTDGSIFGYSGQGDGTTTGARSHSTTSTTDAPNIGFLFGLKAAPKDTQENYTLQNVSTGDRDITGRTLVARSAWAWAKMDSTGSGGTGGSKLMDNGSETAITLTTVSSLFTVNTTSASYPSNAAGIGLRSTDTFANTFLYECGTLLAYLEPINYIVSADSGTFSLTGTAATLKHNHKLPIDSGTFSLTGTDASLERGYPLVAESGTYTLTGTAASLEIGYEVAADSGTFTLTGTAASLRRTYTPLAADSGTFSLTGTAASLKVGYEVAADSGTFSLTGTAASLERGYEVAADSGIFSLTGTVASLEVGYEVAADSGTFTLTGTSANLIYGQGSTYTLPADSGTFSLTGTAASLERGYEVATDSGTYTLTGTAASLERGYEVAADSGTYTLTGTAASLKFGHKLTADSGTYTLTGTAATLKKTSKIAADSGTYTLTGTVASLRRTYTPLAANSGTYTLTGTAASLKFNHKLVSDSAIFSLTGTAALLKYNHKVIANSGTYTLTGTSAELIHGVDPVLAASGGNLQLTKGHACLVHGPYEWSSFQCCEAPE